VTVIREYGDAGLLVEPEGDADQAWAIAQGLAASLADDPPAGFLDVVASFRHAFVVFDPVRTDHASVEAALRSRLHRAAPATSPRTFSVPVLYGGEAGPDLVDVAGELGMTPDELVELHSGDTWVLRFVGSPVAALFVDVPALPAEVPRMRSPRTRIPPGSVAVSGRQSMIYPVPSPGGWRLLGRTPATLFDLADPDLVAYRPGDRVRFVPIGADDWDEWVRRAGRLEPDEQA
jgi:KipI family sensor histidine kinase inhibitor